MRAALRGDQSGCHRGGASRHGRREQRLRRDGGVSSLHSLCSHRLFHGCVVCFHLVLSCLPLPRVLAVTWVKEIVEELRSEGYPIRVHLRKRSEGRGLSSAVLLGFDMVTTCIQACFAHVAPGKVQHGALHGRRSAT